MSEKDRQYSDHNDEDADGGFWCMPPITEEYDGDVSDLFSYEIDRNVSEYDTSDLFSFDIDRNVNDGVCVVMWKLESGKLYSASMDALVWVLGEELHESTVVYLVHVFPKQQFIPTLLGRLPISQANPVQREGFQIQERSKRNKYLQRFVSLCSSSQVEVETMLIESDTEAKVILDLIPVLNIRKLVMGATKSTIRKLKSSSKNEREGILDRILHNAPEYCQVKVICEGKEVLFQDGLTTERQYPSVCNVNCLML